MQIDLKTDLGLCLNAAVRARDADMLHSLIESNSSDERFVQTFTFVWKRLASILTEADRLWFYRVLGGSKVSPISPVTNLTAATFAPALYSPHPKDTLVPIVELAKILQVSVSIFLEYLSTKSSPSVYCFSDRFDPERSGIAFEDVVAIASGLQVFLAEKKIDYYLNQLKAALAQKR